MNDYSPDYTIIKSKLGLFQLARNYIGIGTYVKCGEHACERKEENGVCEYFSRA